MDDEEVDCVLNFRKLNIYKELWKACADPLMCVPKCGERIYYFPKLHSDQLEDSCINVEAGIDQVLISNLPTKVLCRVVDVQLLAIRETDEAYAVIALHPEKDQAEAETAQHLCPPEPPRPQFLSFSKNSTQEQQLIARDIHGKKWPFKHVYRGRPPRHLLTKGWKAFAKKKRFVAGDWVVFIRGENGELCVGVRRKVYQQSCGGLSKAASCGQNKQVVSVTTNCALLKGTIFSVHYDARVSQSIITLPKYLQSVDAASNHYEGEGYRQRKRLCTIIRSDEEMKIDGKTIVSYEVDWEDLGDILPLRELDHEGGTGENGEKHNNSANDDFENQENEQEEDSSPIPPCHIEESGVGAIPIATHIEESGMGAIPIDIQEGSSQVMHMSSTQSQIPYDGPGNGDEKIPWEGYLVAQRCIPTLNRVKSRYPDCLVGFKPRANAVKTMYLEILAEVVYFLEIFTVESLDRSRDELNMAMQSLCDLKDSGIDVSWVEARLVHTDEALKMQSLVQQQNDLVRKFEEARSALGKVAEELGSVNKQLEELSSQVGPNGPATNKPILEGLL